MITNYISITMAGSGSRFKKAGYSTPKYMINVLNFSLFEWSLKSLASFNNNEFKFIFICSKIDNATSFIRNKCKLLDIYNYNIIEIDGRTDGQATTALLSKKYIDNDEHSFSIYNIDTYIDPNYLKPGSIKGDGWLPCFPGSGAHWSFAKADSSNKLLEIREKVRISPNATTGFYYFSSFRLYKESYSEYYKNDKNIEKGEKYIAPLYNYLVDQGMSIYIENIPQSAVYCLGTPEELNDFKSSCLEQFNADK